MTLEHILPKSKYPLVTAFLFFQLFALRRLMQGDEKNPKAPLADNFRPTLDLNQRSIRTNIDFRRKPVRNLFYI